MPSIQDSLICEFCKESFKPKKKWQKFCTNKCRDNFHNDKKYETEKKCPHCKSEEQDMFERLGESIYLCNVCAREFEL